MHLAAGIWKDGKDMRVDKNIQIEIECLNEKKVITILRQFIKKYNYKVFTFEKSIQGKKHITYRLMYINDDFLSPKKNEMVEKRKYIVSFDT